NTDTAIAHDDRSDAMPTRWADRCVPADLRVVMGVRINKAGSDDKTGGVDRLCRTVVDPADLGNSAVHHGDIGLASPGPRAVDNSPTPDQQVVGNLLIAAAGGALDRIGRPAASQLNARRAWSGLLSTPKECCQAGGGASLRSHL